MDMKKIFGDYRSWLLAEQQNSIFQHNMNALNKVTIGAPEKESVPEHVVHTYFLSTALEDVLEDFVDAPFRLAGEHGLHERLDAMLFNLISEVYETAKQLDPDKEPNGFSEAAEEQRRILESIQERFHILFFDGIRNATKKAVEELSADIIKYVQDVYFKSIPVLQKEKLGKHLGSGEFGAVFQFADKKGVVFKIGTKYITDMTALKDEQGKETKFYDDAMSDLFSKKATKSTLPVYDHGQVLLGKKDFANIQEIINKRLGVILKNVKQGLNQIDSMKNLIDEFFDKIGDSVMRYISRSETLENIKKLNKQLDRQYTKMAEAINTTNNMVQLLVNKIKDLYLENSLYYAEIAEVDVAEDYATKQIGDRVPPEVNKLSQEFTYLDVSVAEGLAIQLGGGYENLRKDYQMSIQVAEKDNAELFQKSKNFKEYIETLSSDDYWHIDFNFDQHVELSFRRQIVGALQAMEEEFAKAKMKQQLEPNKKKIMDDMDALFTPLAQHLREFYRDFMYKSFEAVYNLEKKLSKATKKGGNFLWDDNTLDVHFGNFGFSKAGDMIIYDP